MGRHISPMPDALKTHLRTMVEKHDKMVQRVRDERLVDQLKDDLMALAQAYGYGRYRASRRVPPDYLKAAKRIRSFIKGYAQQLEGQPQHGQQGPQAPQVQAIRHPSNSDSKEGDGSCNDGNCNAEDDSKLPDVRDLSLSDQRTDKVAEGKLGEVVPAAKRADQRLVKKPKVVLTDARGMARCHWCQRAIAAAEPCGELLVKLYAHKTCWDRETAGASAQCFKRGAGKQVRTAGIGKCDICDEPMMGSDEVVPSRLTEASHVRRTKQHICRCCVRDLMAE
ncbi:hypothetical protein TSOC_004731 [Tetrabaena socialis]|uniref:Uncharacterized protein n=1 Tax=Tetrabaena socialis TaxID=47790 RepID=A0A2J8A872_9CHLO|nr:hypothetical protein TSOC_004731 [Tetrabaena socialis]|eukprot:PNH08708.1 hypothetical protein TSOC_004731 [Tetrabaena socialis]